ncbi:MAG: hypothetical protein K8T91_24045 [Planctomycetes bacterium]|nr:hypothetical protein [Planctomycetota bacterium]
MDPVRRLSVFAGSSPQIMARVLGNLGTPVSSKELASITCRSFAKSTATLAYTLTLDIAAVIFEELQKDVRWSADEIGYNFRCQLSPDAFPAAGESYRIEFTFEVTDGSKFFSIWEVDVEPLYSTSPEIFQSHLAGLTPKQREAYQLISSEGPIIGKTIARRIEVELPTLKRHILPALRPLGLTNDQQGDGYYIKIN